MNKKMGNVWITAIGIILLVYTASRSYEFLAMTLPPEKQILAIAGLVALDGGLVLWLLTYQSTGLGMAQRGIAMLMILIDFLGSFLTFVADTLYNTGKMGITFAMSENDIFSIVLAVSVVIGANVGAATVFHMLDPEAQKKRALSDAKAHIDEEAIRLVQDGAPQLAAKMAPQMAASVLGEHEADLRIKVSEAKSRTRRMQSTANRIDPDAVEVLPAQIEDVPAQIPAKLTKKEEEPELQPVVLANPNPTIRPVNGNGRHS